MQLNTPTLRLAYLTSSLVRKMRLLERQEMTCCGVPVSQAMVLQALHKSGGSLRMGDVAALLGVVQSTATRLVEPLVEQECVRRERAPEDGRVVLIALTPRADSGPKKRWRVPCAGARMCSGGFPRLGAPRCSKPWKRWWGRSMSAAVEVVAKRAVMKSE